MPIAPTPAQPSRKVQPLTVSPRMLNKVSRSLSLVGLVPEDGPELKCLLLNCPAIMRISTLPHRNQPDGIHTAAQREPLNETLALLGLTGIAIGFLLRK